LNEEFRDDGQQFSTQFGLRIAMLVSVLEDIEIQRELLYVQQGKLMSGSGLGTLLALMNWAEYHLRELEADIQKPSKVPASSPYE
jgi:hypothetical protein